MNKETPKVSPDDLVVRYGITYKKFTNIPFTGYVEGVPKGTYKNGKRDGVWEFHNENGSLSSKTTYKDGEIINTE